MSDFMIGAIDMTTLNAGSADQQVRQMSVFDMLKESKYSNDLVRSRDQSLREDFKDFTKL
jgi:hypothetical protein